ncbi:MAG TPA: M81 family metallopeptidase [Kofleriaceae bacterium]|nr:M81 family metallopeptidase [Kofleriaceae bacterium]
MKRLAFARIMQESNALSPVPTVLADFESAHFEEGDGLLRAATAGPEVPGFFKRAELGGFMQAVHARKAEVEPVPLVSAWASSGGPLSKECFEALEARLVDRLRAAGRIDGLFLALHGAMGVLGVPDPESRLLRSVREVIGGTPIVVSHDLHGNVTRARVAAADAIVAYQTNPHRDHAKIGKKAGDILIGTVLGEVKPTMAWRSLPMILGGGKTIDFLAPMRAVFKHMKRAEKAGDALAASTFMVHPWNDDPALGWSTVVVTNNDVSGAERLAEQLAEMCWERRHRQPPQFPSASAAIAQARAAKLRRKLGCVMLADASDVVTAGAPGDSTHLMRALLEEGQGLLAYCAVRDPQAIETLWPHAEGDRVSLSIGGTLDPSRSPPLAVTGSVLGKHEQRGFLRTVVLAVEHLRIVITEGPSMVMRPAFYTDVGLSPWKADVVMVKNFFPFLMFFLPYSRKNIFVRTHGATDFDAAFQLRFDGPMHPRDDVDEWRARDRARRGFDAPPSVNAPPPVVAHV